MSKTAVSILRLTLCIGAIIFSLTAVSGVEDWRLWTVGAGVVFLAIQSALAVCWDLIEEKGHIRRIIINELSRFFRGVASD